MTINHCKASWEDVAGFAAPGRQEQSHAVRGTGASYNGQACYCPYGSAQFKLVAMVHG